MDNVRPITADLSVAGQVTAAQLQQAAEAGFKSVFNLRAPGEEGYLSDEQALAEAAGLTYAATPVKPPELDQATIDSLLAEIDALPKPALIHCGVGLRAGAMAMMHLATRQGMTPEQAFAKAEELGFDCSASPQLKQLFQQYVGQHSQASE